VLFSVIDRDNNPATPLELLFGININSFALGTLASTAGVNLPEPPNSFVIPNLGFVVSGVPSLPATSLNDSEKGFFETIYGSIPDDFTINLEPGLNLKGQIPISVLPAPIVSALSANPGDVLLLEGGIGVTFEPSFELQTLSLTAVMPAELTLPGLPDWITTAGGGLSLELG